MNGFERKCKEGRREDNVDGLVRKSKGFLPMNLSNPKRKFFYAKGTDCGGRGRTKAVVFEKKLREAFLSV